ncbi:MAG: flagellin [Nitrososphaera sp.]|uniref:flagellin n=1 Tax=Nitrososphaera sp. TaxID=1971748 RepID=UPI003D6F5339
MVSVGISEGIMLMASVIVATSLSGMVIGKTSALNSAFTVSSEAQKDLILTKIKIVYAAGNSTSPAVKVWVKNTGSTPLANTDKLDVYFGKIGSSSKVPYNAGSAPKWVYSTAVTQWQVKDTVQIDITSSANLSASSTYVVRIATPNGVTDEYLFST